MDPLLISAASGMRARMESLEMLANNLANSSTGGFKTDREFYSLYTAAEAAEPAAEGLAPDPDAAPVIQRHWTDLSQGSIRQTGNATDLALDGSGFFTVNSPGGVLYTRNGSLKINAGGTLTTGEGYPLVTTDGKTITLQSSRPFEVSTNGTVTQDGQALGQLAIVNFPDQTAIDKRGLNFFFSVDPKMKPQPAQAEVRQGTLEQSNVGSAESAVRLVSVMRQFESLQKAMTIGVEMNRRAVEEVARVTQ